MKKLSEDDETYFNTDGFTVMTEEYLLQRGYCCGNSCLNCPYYYKNVPEPIRTILLEKRKALNNNASKQE